MCLLGAQGLLGGAVPTAHIARGAGLVLGKTDSVPLEGGWRERDPILLVHLQKNKEELASDRVQ